MNGDPDRGMFRILLGAFAGALKHPLLLLLGWLIVTVPAALAVLPAYAATDAALSSHAGASYLADDYLDADLARLTPAITLRLTGGLAFVLLAWTFLAGGVIATAATGLRVSWRQFLITCSVNLLRNLRVILLGLLLALLLGWGADATASLLRERWADADPGPFLSIPGLAWFGRPFVAEAVAWGFGFLFLLLLFLAKVALARLVLHDRSCALLAWLRSFGTLLRRPLRMPLTVAGFAFVWLLGSHLIGMGTAYLLEVRQQIWLGLACGQLGVLWSQVALVAFLLAAREFVPALALRVEPVTGTREVWLEPETEPDTDPERPPQT